MRIDIHDDGTVTIKPSSSYILEAKQDTVDPRSLRVQLVPNIVDDQDEAGVRFT